MRLKKKKIKKAQNWFCIQTLILLIICMDLSTLVIIKPSPRKFTNFVILSPAQNQTEPS